MMHLKQKNKYLLLCTLCSILVIFVACNRPKGVLSQGKMADVITDLYKLDGSLAAKGIGVEKINEKNEYYTVVLKKYDITQAEFDSSLTYYTKNPKKFERIYENVLSNLTDFQKDINNGKYHQVDTTELHKIRYDIWNKARRYALTKDSARTRLSFEIPEQNFMLGDVFTLKMLHKIAKTDSSTNKQIRLQINYSNGRVFGIIKKIPSDGVTRRITLKVRSVYPSKIKSVSGEILGCSAFKGKQNALIDSISLMRMYDVSKQDSLKKVLQKHDPKNFPPTPAKRDFRKSIL